MGFLGQLSITTAINILSHGYRSKELFPKNMGLLRKFTKAEHLRLPKTADFLFQLGPGAPFSISKLIEPRRQIATLIKIIRDRTAAVAFRLREQKTERLRYRKFGHKHK